MTPVRNAPLAGAALVTLVVTSPVIGGATAGAEEVSRQELAALAGRAGDDPAALDRLRHVDRVDGRPADLGRALDGPDQQAAARARALAAELADDPGPAVVPASGELRAQARSILAERRFHPSRTPRPFAGALRRIGGWIRPVGDPVRRLVQAVADNPVGLPVLGGLVVALAALVSVRLAGRRKATNLSAGQAARRPTQVDPAELERRAEQAERENELELAFRLRFQAGLLRLHDAGRLRLRPSTTTGELVRTVGSPTLGTLAATLEEIVYGGRATEALDLEAARAGWARILAEART